MIKVNYGTKLADDLIYDMNYHHYKGKTIFDVYKSISSAKYKSWQAIERECERLHGENLHIVGASCHSYSCIYAYPIKSSEGFVSAMVIRKETKGNTYELQLSLEEYRKRVSA